jgi:excisionase family DNA binding protein
MPPSSLYEDLPVALDVATVAKLLNCHRQTVYSMIKRGELSAFHVGRLMRVPRHELLNFLGVTDTGDNTP